MSQPANVLELLEQLEHIKYIETQTFLDFCSNNYNINTLDDLLKYIRHIRRIFKKKRINRVSDQVVRDLLKILTRAVHWSLLVDKITSKYRYPLILGESFPRHEKPNNPEFQSLYELLQIAIPCAAISIIIYNLYRYIKKDINTLQSDHFLLECILQRKLRESEAQFTQLNWITHETFLKPVDLYVTVNNLLRTARHQVLVMQYWMSNNFRKVYNDYPEVIDLIIICGGFVVAYHNKKKEYLIKNKLCSRPPRL